MDASFEESLSLWSSPIVMLPKKDGTRQVCNDFQKLNEASQFDSYPMSQVDELVKCLGRANYISSLDLTKGYWQVQLSKNARKITAICTLWGHWQYQVLPFGLHRVVEVFQRLMDIVLHPHRAYARPTPPML